MPSSPGGRNRPETRSATVRVPHQAQTRVRHPSHQLVTHPLMCRPQRGCRVAVQTAFRRYIIPALPLLEDQAHGRPATSSRLPDVGRPGDIWRPAWTKPDGPGRAVGRLADDRPRAGARPEHPPPPATHPGVPVGRARLARRPPWHRAPRPRRARAAGQRPRGHPPRTPRPPPASGGTGTLLRQLPLIPASRTSFEPRVLIGRAGTRVEFRNRPRQGALGGTLGRPGAHGRG